MVKQFTGFGNFGFGSNFIDFWAGRFTWFNKTYGSKIAQNTVINIGLVSLFHWSDAKLAVGQ